MAGRDARPRRRRVVERGAGAGGASAASASGDGAEARDGSSSRPGVAADRSTDDAGVRGAGLRPRSGADRAARAPRRRDVGLGDLRLQRVDAALRLQ